MKLIFLVNALLVFWPLSSLNVHAEGNCPSGSYPIGGGNAGWTGCAPIPGAGSGVGGGNEGAQWRSYVDPAPVWQDRWGAIAGDKSKGIIGTVTGFPSKSAAQQAAIADCTTKGGIQCKVENSYVNGCTAMTVGNRVYNTASNATLNEAIVSGMQKCREVDKNCTTIYSACSPPVRIQ